MALIKSKNASGSGRNPSPEQAGEVVAVRVEHTLTVAQNVTDNIIEMVPLPAHCRVVDAILECDDLDTDTAPALVLDVGTMTGDVGEDLDADGNARTCDDEIFDGVTTGQAGGVARPTLVTAFRIAPVAYNRSIGIKIATEAATPAEGKIALTLFFGT